MRITARTSTLYIHGPLMGTWVVSCAGSEPFGTPTDKLTGI
jgi:hypothetical protein